MSRRVVVTGLGIICPVGTTVEEVWRHTLEGKTPVTEIPPHWFEYSDYASRIWVPLPEIDYAAAGITRVERMQHDPVSLLAVCAAKDAIKNAGYGMELADKRANVHRIEGLDRERTGVFMGTGIGGANSFLRNHSHQVLHRNKNVLSDLRTRLPVEDQEFEQALARMEYEPRFNPFVVSMLMPNAVSAVIGIKLSLNGPNTTYSVACASGTVALGNGFLSIRNGDLDVVLAGGSEYLDDYYGGIFRGFDTAGALVRDYESAETANRPFDVRRSGFLFSQGAAVVMVLEALEVAQARNAPILSEITGYAESFDAHSMMSIGPSGMQIERVMRDAVRQAGVSQSAVDYINAHGTSTVANDQIEAEVIGRLFGNKVLINSTKSIVGHTIGASGALEAAITSLSLKHQMVHKSVNLEQPVADLNFVMETQSHPLQVAMSTSYAFGGHNAALVLSRYS